MLELFSTASDREKERLLALEATRLLDSPASEEFDRITRLTARLLDVPTALVSLVASDRQWFKSSVGINVPQTEREVAFCHYTIREPEILVVEDATLDKRFQHNRLVVNDPGIRFYAGVPLVTEQGHALGSLCVIDYRPRTLSHEDRESLKDLARMVMAQINLTVSIGRVHEVTNLPNRAQLKSDLQDLGEIGESGRRTLVVVDIMSHAQMQAALLALGVSALEKSVRVISGRLQTLMGAKTTLYHVSDTRFAYLLSGRCQRQSTSIIDAVLMKMREPFKMDGVTFTIDLRCGAVCFDAAKDKTSDLMRQATAALVQPGSDSTRFHWYGSDLDVPHQRSYALLRTVPESLENGEFRLVYQPKLNAATRRCTGVEALLRWSHPVMGNVSPGEFIPAVEKTQAIHAVTRWVLDAALAQVALWQAQKLFITVAINVSSHNLEHPGFAESVREACERHGVHARYLHIECTENTALTGRRTIRALHAIRELGAQISLDDFGIGYSNMACLNELPISLIKLDQSLIKPITADFKAWTLAQSLIAFGHSLGYRVLGEGVEDEETCRLLLEAGCDALQGYYISRPLEADAIPAFFWSEQARIPAALR